MVGRARPPRPWESRPPRPRPEKLFGARAPSSVGLVRLESRPAPERKAISRESAHVPMPMCVCVLTTLVATWSTALGSVGWGSWGLAWSVALVSAGWGLVDNLHWWLWLLVGVLIVVVAYRLCCQLSNSSHVANRNRAHLRGVECSVPYREARTSSRGKFESAINSSQVLVPAPAFDKRIVAAHSCHEC